MEYIKVCKVNDVLLYKQDDVLKGTLHLTPHHLIFSHPSEEKWVTYSLISSVECLPKDDDDTYPLEIRCHHFLFFTLSFHSQASVLDAFESIQKLSCIDNIQKVYAFSFQPNTPFSISREAGWKFFDPMQEFKRMGVQTLNKEWRFTDLNSEYQFSPSYPKVLVIPSSISDNVLNYARKYRSKYRLPVLTYLHRNGASITRSSQPLVGLKQNRSVQDERLVQAIFSTKPAQNNLIVDARPAANAMANVAIGAGTEIMDFYPNCKREFMGIENIHVVRESLIRLADAVCIAGGKGVINKIQLSKSNWLKHIRSLLDGANKIVHHVDKLKSHVLVHCSDGWDRTTQLTSLSTLYLDPYYRTLRGFATLIEKDWISFGHKFQSRTGHLTKERAFVDNSKFILNHTNNPSLLSNMQNKLYQYQSTRPGQDKESCPIFHQFLDATFQLWIQNPTSFEFNERFLIYLHRQVYACQFGNFLFDNEYQINQNYSILTQHTYSIWSKIFSHPNEYLNPIYTPTDDLLKMDTRYLKYWSSLFYRKDEDLNYQSPPPSSTSPIPQPSQVDSFSTKLVKLMESAFDDFSKLDIGNINNNQSAISSSTIKSDESDNPLDSNTNDIGISSDYSKSSSKPDPEIHTSNPLQKTSPKLKHEYNINHTSSSLSPSPTQSSPIQNIQPLFELEIPGRSSRDTPLTETLKEVSSEKYTITTATNSVESNHSAPLKHPLSG